MTCRFEVGELPDVVLLDALAGLMSRSRANDAALLAYLAEVEARGLYLPAACSSMHVYCLRVLHMSEDAAFKRMAAARVARRFPAVLDAVAGGRLHLSAVVMLASHLTEANVLERIDAASHRSKREIEGLIARWAPRPDVPERLEVLPLQLAGLAVGSSAPGQVNEGAPAASPGTRAVPIAPERFALQVTIDRATRDKLEQAQALLRHRVPSGNLAEVVDRALDALLVQLRSRKFAVTKRARGGADDEGTAAENEGARDEDAAGRRTRHVPAQVKRAVHGRDGEQCSFVSAEGVRCTERGFLELDHVDAFAAGGGSSADRMRVLCRAHNQYEADRRFGRGFMEARRRRRRTSVRGASVARGPNVNAAPDLTDELMLSLRGLGVAPADARAAIDDSAHVPAASLEERLRAALRALHVTYANRVRETATPWRKLVAAPAVQVSGAGRGGDGR